MKNRMETSWGSKWENFDQISSENPEVVAHMDYLSLEIAMVKRQKKVVPNIPVNSKEASTLLSGNSCYNTYYADTVLEGDGQAIVFMFQTMQEFTSTPTIQEIQIDATFKSCPAQFYQLFIVLST